MPEPAEEGEGEWTVVSGSRAGRRRSRGRGAAAVECGSGRGQGQGLKQQQQKGPLPAWHQSTLRAGYSEAEIEREAARLRAALEERKDAMSTSAFYRRLEEEVRRRLRREHDDDDNDDNDKEGGGEEERVAMLVCYGLGSVQSTTCNALWQLACLFLLRDAFLPLPPSHHGDGEGATATSAATETAAAEVFDPIFDAVDRRLLTSLGLRILASDDAGKRALAPLPSESAKGSSGSGGGGKTLFFMPHCPRRLYSNLLWANWAPHALPRLVVAGNSLASYVDRALPSERGKDPTDCLAPLLPLARETPISWTPPSKEGRRRGDGDGESNEGKGQQEGWAVAAATATAAAGDGGGARATTDRRAWEAGAPAAFMDFSVFDFPRVPAGADVEFWEARRPPEHTGPMTDG